MTTTCPHCHATVLSTSQRAPEPVAWRWRTLPKFSEDAADQEWELTLAAPSFINPHHHEVEPLYAAAPAQRVLDEEVYRGLQEAMMLIGAKNDNVSEAVKASNINAAWHILDRIISDGGAPVYCAHCDHEHPLHEDARGFHHVIRGERVPCCSVPSTDNSGAK